MAAKYADDKLAEEITLLDLRGLSSITDFFLICSGTSRPHLKAIHGEIRDKLKNEHSIAPQHSDGQGDSQWVVLDYTDVMVHIFHHSRRSHFALEDLWGDAPRVELENLEGAAKLEVEA